MSIEWDEMILAASTPTLYLTPEALENHKPDTTLNRQLLELVQREVSTVIGLLDAGEYTMNNQLTMYHILSNIRNNILDIQDDLIRQMGD